LYNPDRVTRPLLGGKPVGWSAALRALHENVAGRIAEDRGYAIAWLTGETSDSDADLIELLVEPTGTYAPMNLRLVPEAPLARAAERLFGYDGMPEFDVGKADLIVSFGADFLETWGNPVGKAAGFASMHAFREGARGRAVYVGPRQSTTAAACDSWIPLTPGCEAAALQIVLDGFLSELAGWAREDLGAARRMLEAMPPAEAEPFVQSRAEELRALGARLASAKTPLVVASGCGPDGDLAHVLALLITHLAGGSGQTVRFPEAGRAPRGDEIVRPQGVIANIDTGPLEVLMVHQADPRFLVPSAQPALDKAQFVVCFTTQLDDTAAQADLVLPIHHSLESWGDHAAAAGVVGILQPTIRPLFGTRSFADLVLSIAREIGGQAAQALPWADAREYTEARLATYHRTSGSERPLDEFVRETRRRGGIWTDVAQTVVRLEGDASLPDWRKPEPSGESPLKAHIFPHPYLYDGRGADKPWLQEVPETSTSAVWGSWAEIHPDTARSLGIQTGSAVVLNRGEAEITVPALITKQIVPGVVALPIGQGHERLGRWASGRGANPLRLLTSPDVQNNLALSGIAVKHRIVAEGGPPLIRTAGSQDQEDRKLARTMSLKEAQHGEGHGVHEEPSIYPEHEHNDYDWAMVIDLDACIACGACIVACYAENNVAAVGPEKVAQGREMSWIRLEKYVGEDNKALFLLNLCQHCHKAPCEAVCPVHAAYHNPEGLNVQVYNRCVGTRYCSNNCPYKVRRFNWFDYRVEAPLDLQLNPDVTVRERGVMEKCTFCIQRIVAAREQAKNENERKVRDGEIVPACAQTCPTGAITFGNILDPTSRVARLAKDARGYQLLDELGTRPSVTYLKRVVRDEDA
jgi:molybdopterin-containing oxidoreductase family iron-sulfur binding subunit